MVLGLGGSLLRLGQTLAVSLEFLKRNDGPFRFVKLTFSALSSAIDAIKTGVLPYSV